MNFKGFYLSLHLTMMCYFALVSVIIWAKKRTSSFLISTHFPFGTDRLEDCFQTWSSDLPSCKLKRMNILLPGLQRAEWKLMRECSCFIQSCQRKCLKVQNSSSWGLELGAAVIDRAAACAEFSLHLCLSFYTPHPLQLPVAPQETHQSVLVRWDHWGNMQLEIICVLSHLMRRRILTW